MTDEESSNVTYDLETIEAVGEKSVYFNMLFSGLYDNTPFVSDIPARMRHSNMVDNNQLPAITLTPMQHSILENYGLVDTFERFKSIMEAGAKENGEMPDYHSCFLAIPLFVSVIKNYMKSHAADSQTGSEHDFIDRNGCFIEAINGIDELGVEWQKIPARKTYMKEAMETMLREMHKDEADILDIVLKYISSSS
jgi:hypothetical protein